MGRLILLGVIFVVMAGLVEGLVGSDADWGDAARLQREAGEREASTLAIDAAPGEPGAEAQAPEADDAQPPAAGVAEGEAPAQGGGAAEPQDEPASPETTPEQASPQETREDADTQRVCERSSETYFLTRCAVVEAARPSRW